MANNNTNLESPIQALEVHLPITGGTLARQRLGKKPPVTSQLANPGIYLTCTLATHWRA
jgi:hypothetical protein